MHIQVPTPGWLDSAMMLPDHSLLKAVSDAGPLREAKIKWAELGRDPRKLVTCYRHYGLEPAPPGSTWAQAVAHWRVNFPKFIDGTWRDRFAPYVDLIEDCNEYTAVSTWVDDPDHGGSKLLSMEAAAWVWREDYRGQGVIPSTCKFTLMCGPVANWWPVEVYRLSVKYDAPINYHAYAQCLNGERVPNDFHDASGLASNLESHYGVFPEYVYGEVGPYKSSAEGWRAPGCLNANQDKLVAVARQVQIDTQQTRLFREGRLLGYNSFGAWFTVGGGLDWALYELESTQLSALAMMYREIAQEVDVDAITKAKIKEHTAAINALVDGKWWVGKPVPFTIPPQNRAVTMYHSDASPFVPPKVLNVTWVMTCDTVSGDLLRVSNPTGDVNDLWIRAGEVTGMS